MPIDPQLIEILACPECRGRLALSDDRRELECQGCPLAYPIRDEIPVMLIDEARRR
jgi:uncharacterized protein YbaR (Trm112 family)